MQGDFRITVDSLDGYYGHRLSCPTVFPREPASYKWQQKQKAYLRNGDLSLYPLSPGAFLKGVQYVVGWLYIYIYVINVYIYGGLMVDG